MPKETAQQAARRIAKERLTGQRLTLLGWAFAASLCGIVGLAAFQTGGDVSFMVASPYAGVRLPSAGPVSSTASIGLNGQDISLGVYDDRDPQATSDGLLEKGHLETLQKEIVGLRRRMSQLSEQNGLYSRRLAALEEKLQAKAYSEQREKTPAEQMPLVGANPLPKPAKTASAPSNSGKSMPVPAKALPQPQGLARGAGEDRGSPHPALAETDDRNVRSRIETIPAPETRTRKPFLTLSQLPRGANKDASQPEVRPVELVRLPQPDDSDINPSTPMLAAGQPLPAADGDEPVETASIPPQTATAPTTDPLFSAPQSNAQALEALIKRSPPAGRMLGDQNGRVRRSDFAVVLGTYLTEEEAAAAWRAFRKDNDWKVRGLSARVAPSQFHEDETELLIGPFANAADATVACLHLLSSTSHCRPALFTGTPVPDAPARARAQN